MLLDSDKALNEHYLSLTNEQADRKTKSNSEAVSADILSSLIKWLSWTFITDRVYHQQCSQCFNKEVAVLPSTWISSEVWLSSWNREAAHRFCESTVSWWTSKGPELALERHGSGMETFVWGSNYDVQLQASVYDL